MSVNVGKTITQKVVISNPVDYYSIIGRVNYTYKILIDGKDVKDWGWDEYINTIIVERKFPGEDTAEIIFNNTDKAEFTSMLSFSVGKMMKISLGYVGLGLFPAGEFLVINPEYEFFPEAGPKIKLRGISETLILNRKGEVQKVWENLKDSEIAAQIASKYKLKTDIEDTKTKLDFVVQASLNDLDFLKTRARLYGYLIYVRSGVLHFHSYKVVDNGAKIAYKSGTSTVFDLKFAIDTFRKFSKFKKSEVDINDQRVHKVTSQNKPDELSKQSDPFYTALSLVKKDNGIQSTEFIIGEGHVDNPAEIQKQINKIQESSGWSIVSAIGSGVGMEFLVPGEVVSINAQNQDRFAGNFLCTYVRHMITADYFAANKGYTTDFELRRSFLGTDVQDINFFISALLSLVSLFSAATAAVLGSTLSANSIPSGPLANLQTTGNTVSLNG